MRPNEVTGDGRELLDVTQRPVFRPFDVGRELQIHVRNLPHWRQPGATYFVTLRQDDSIPQAVLTEWLERRDRWYLAHGITPAMRSSLPSLLAERYRAIPVSERRALERQNARLFHEELDRHHGSCVLRHAEPRQVVADSLAHFHGKRLWLGDYVVMPNHLHALVVPFPNWNLESWLGTFTRWTSRQIGIWLTAHVDVPQPARDRHGRYRLWQHEPFDHLVRDQQELVAYRNYIGQNPSKAQVPDKECTLGRADWLDDFAPLAK